jgi:subtilisin-like proprotein convertase family protein
MKANVSQCLARLASFFWGRPARRPLARRRARPTLECLEDRALLSTLGVVNLGSDPGGTPRMALAAATAPSQAVFRATDVPQRVDSLDVFTTSSIDVPQGLTIASLKVRLDVTYPLDNDLTIDLIAPDGTDVPLSAFEGTGANFQGTTFDDAAATPVGAGNSPFAGSYRPESPLSALSGKKAQGTWQLQIVDWGAGSGTLNSWSLIITPAGSPNVAAGTAGQPVGTSPVAAPSPALAPTAALPFAALPLAGRYGLTVGGTAATVPMSPPSPVAGNSFMDGLAVLRSQLLGADSALVPPDAGLHSPADTHIRDSGPGESASANILIGNDELGGAANSHELDLALVQGGLSARGLENVRQVVSS